MHYFLLHLVLEQVVITQMNGMEQPSESIHILHVGKMRMKLSKDDMTIAKEFYSNSMQVLQDLHCLVSSASIFVELDGLNWHILKILGVFKSEFSTFSFSSLSYVGFEEVEMLQLRRCFGKPPLLLPSY